MLKYVFIDRFVHCGKNKSFEVWGFSTGILIWALRVLGVEGCSSAMWQQEQYGHLGFRNPEHLV